MDATQVPTSSLSKPQSPVVEWDIDGADEIPAEGSPAAGLGEMAAEGGATSEEQAPALADAPELTQSNPDSEWDIDSPTVKLPSVETGNAGPVPETDETDQEEEPTDLDDIEAEAEEDTANAMGQVEDAELPASEEDPEAGGETPGEPHPTAGATGEVEAATKDDILAKIVEAEKECERAAAVVEALKSRQKEAKEDLAAAVNRLRRLAREIGEDYERPLLKQQPAKVIEQPQQQPEPVAEAPATETETQATAPAAAGSPVKRSLENGDTPIRVRYTGVSQDFPQLARDSEHDVLKFYVDQEAEDEDLPDCSVSIQDPTDEDGVIYLGSHEYDVLEWLGGDDVPAEGQEEMRESEVDARISESAAAAGPQEEDQSWREQRLLEDIGLAPNLCTLLADNPDKTIKTLGHLVDWQSKGNDLTDIPKVGPAKVDKINEALDKFWKRWGAK